METLVRPRLPPTTFATGHLFSTTAPQCQARRPGGSEARWLGGLGLGVYVFLRIAIFSTLPCNASMTLPLGFAAKAQNSPDDLAGSICPICSFSFLARSLSLSLSLVLSLARALAGYRLRMRQDEAQRRGRNLSRFPSSFTHAFIHCDWLSVILGTGHDNALPVWAITQVPWLCWSNEQELAHQHGLGLWAVTHEETYK